jgi:lincosamide and streptogramin A transport system ATP-binding/permease protein
MRELGVDALMAQINVNNLTFSYDGSADTVLEDVNFNIDSAWKLGMIGRNGKGKTTLLNLLRGKYEYSGSISTGMIFDYFPYDVNEADLEKTADELAAGWKPHAENWQILMQINQIGLDPELLYRPFKTLSHGERTQVMLAVLFAGENEFLLIDEPTNHLDTQARNVVKEYLNSKKGFILVSHDRDLLDTVCDHVLVLNRKTVEVQTGNFSSWWENKERSDAFAKAENEKHLREIGKLKEAADRTARWAEKNEGTKIGFDPLKEHDRSKNTRAFIGAKTKKMQARVKAYGKRIDNEIEEKEGLLQDIEEVADLKLMPMRYHKEVLVEARDLCLRYEGAEKDLFLGMRFRINRGDRVFLAGENGCGKSSIIKAILQKLAAGGLNTPAMRQSFVGNAFADIHAQLKIGGILDVSSGLIISYINQDTSFLSGSLQDFCERHALSYSIFLAILRQLDFGRAQFAKNIEDFSEGQKKKVLIAASLLTPAHLYIWDEPLNYIDVFSRMQIEKLILEFEPTMLLVEHDERFREKIATQTISVGD